ncbi:MAG: metallophosphoesterase family protein [Chloroflexota bacterium]
MPTNTVYFVHISDTHIGRTPDFELNGRNALARAERLVETINTLPAQPDFVVHTGDVVNEPHPEAYRLAARVFGRLDLPVYYVVGNHDRAAEIHHFLPMGPRQDLSPDRDMLSYIFESKGYRFLVTDARGPDEIAPRGRFSQRQLDLVRQEIERGGPPLVVFTHFPILPLDAVWMDTNMLTVNGPAFHELLQTAGARLRGVFHGHVHRPMQTMRDGILYASAASSLYQLGAWPHDAGVRIDENYPPGYSFVHLLPEQTIIHHHVVGGQG